MADTEHLKNLLDLLTDQIDDLKETLAPLTGAPLTDTARKLPVLDKAKLHVLVTYGIESLLFSSLRLSSVQTKSHPIMTELQRVKQYVAKIKEAEKSTQTPEPRNLTLDKAAAGRILKTAMREVDRADEERKAAKEKEVAEARKKLEAMGEGVKDGPGERVRDEDGDDEITGLEEEGKGEKSVSEEKDKKREERKRRRENETPEEKAERKKKKAEKKERKAAKGKA